MLVDNYIKASSIKFNISIAPCVEIARYLKSNQQQQVRLQPHEDPKQLLSHQQQQQQPDTQYHYQNHHHNKQYRQRQRRQTQEHKQQQGTPRIRRPSSSLSPLYSPKTKKSTPNKTTKTLLHKSSTSPTSPPPPKKKKSKNRIIVPNEFINCDLDIIITLINRMLISLIKLNDNNINNNNNTTNINNPTPPTRFHSKTPPAISIFSYINRLTKFNNLKSSGLITMIYYIDILSYMYPHFQLNSWTIHRFLLVATMISQKAMEDYFYTNDHYAKVGGVSLEELNCLELDFLKRIDWRTIPINNPNVQQLYYNKLVEMTGKISNMVDNNNSGDSDNTDTRYKHTKFIMENEDPTDDEEEEEGDLEDLEEDLEDDDDEDDEFYDSDEDINSEDNGDIEIDDYEMEEENNSNVPDLPNIPMYKYDNNGFSMDGSSSPHLKRRYSKD